MSSEVHFTPLMQWGNGRASGRADISSLTISVMIRNGQEV